MFMEFVDRIWEFLVRFRTWLVNVFGATAILLPDLLSAPEVIAVIPEGYQKYVFVSVFLLNIWMRPRPAVMRRDMQPEYPHEHVE